MPVIPLTEQETDDALQSGFSLDETDQFTFSIPNATSTPDPSLFWEPGDYDDDPLWTNRQPFDTYSVLDVTQAANFRLAIAAWDELIEPDFTEVVPDNTNALGHGEVRVAFTADNMTPGTAGYAFQGSNQTPTSLVGDIWLNSTTTSATFDVGTDDYATFLHEIGHVLGLKHPFESPVITAGYDDTRFTVMSYTTPYAVVITPTGGGGYSIAIGPVNPLTPSVLDIRAVQSTYGADTTTRTGNDTYTFNQVDTVYRSIYDAGGTDTIDLTGVTRDSIIDLRPGSTSSVGGPWSEAEQIAYYAAITGDTEANISDWFNDPDPAAVWYDWTNNLGIAFSTTIENLIAGSGDDTITGNSVANTIRLNLGGNDTVDGGDGNDGFYFGGAFNGLDVVDGGAGTLDQIGLQGNYAGLTFAATSFTNLEMIVLLAGNDTSYGDPGTNLYDYNLTTVDANVAAGQLFAVSFNQLLAGEDVTFNGAAETNGAFLTYGGMGVETLTGGAGDDGFYFGSGRFGASETLNGNAGTLDQLGLQGDHTIIFGAGQLSGIEMIVCLSATDARFNGNAAAFYDYSLTMNEGNVAAGGVLYISANQLIAGETLTFNGSAEADGGRYVVYGGDGDDMIHGSLAGDRVYGNGGADGLVGNGGADVFAYTDVSDSTAAAPDFLSDFAAEDVIDLSAIDADTTTGGDQAFTFIGTAAFSNTPGELRVIVQPGPYVIQGDINGDGVADLTINIAPTNVPTGADFLL